MKIVSYNRLITEPYKKTHKIEGQISNGFSTVKQKKQLIGLRILADGCFVLGNTSVTVEKDQIAYFKEERLYSEDWAKKTYSSDAIGEEFILAEPIFLVMIKNK